jgi:hypothetical protein
MALYSRKRVSKGRKRDSHTRDPTLRTFLIQILAQLMRLIPTLSGIIFPAETTVVDGPGPRHGAHGESDLQ